MSHTGDRCKTEALIQTARKAQGWGPRVREGSQEGSGLALEGRLLALGLSWETARDSDDFNPSSAQTILNPWVVLLSVHSTKAKWAQIQDGQCRGQAQMGQGSLQVPVQP